MATDVRRPGLARLRPKNQLTIPDAALAAVGAQVGDRFVADVEDGAIRLEPVRKSYAGSLATVYGPDEAEEIRRDRNACRG